jgi:hypothetical protein
MGIFSKSTTVRKPTTTKKTSTTTKVVVGAAGIAILAFTADAAYNLSVSNNTIRKITSVSQSLLDGSITIKFTPNVPIMGTDTLDISGSQTNPSINGTGITPSSVDINTPDAVTIASRNTLTGLTPGGDIKVTSSLTAQSSYLARSGVKLVTDTAGNIFDDFFGGAYKYVFYACILSGVLIMCIVIFAVIYFTQKK